MSEREQIIERIEEFRDCMKTGKDYTYMYSDDACILGEGRAPVVGKEQIAKELVFEFSRGMADMIYDDPVIEVHGDIATCWMLIKLINKEGEVYLEGKGMLVWKRHPESKEWQMHIDMYNNGR